MMIELVTKSSWDEATFGEPLVIDTCVAKGSLLLIASLHHVALWNYNSGVVDQQINITEKICSSSLHPSGNHVLIGCKEKLRLANVLNNDIQVFDEKKTRMCIDVKFNRTGTIYAAICGPTIEVYSFTHGTKLASIDCDVPFSGLRWGNNCSLYATSDGKLCHWDAVNGEKIGEYCDIDAQILDSAITPEGNVLIVSSNNTLLILNSHLQVTSKVGGDESIEDPNCLHELTGPITVSDEGMVFLSVRHRESNVFSIRIISMIGQEEFDQDLDLTAINVLIVSNDGRFLMANNKMFSVKDSRGYKNSIITAGDEGQEEFVYEETSEVLVASIHVENQMALLQDVQSRLADAEMLSGLELKSTQEQIDASINNRVEQNTNIERSEIEKLDVLRREKEAINEQCIQALEEVKASYAREIRERELKHKDELLRQVKTHYETENEWEKEMAAMDAMKQQMHIKQKEEVERVRSNAKDQLAEQQKVVDKLLKEKEIAERESKEIIAQLEDDIEIIVTKTQQQINSDEAKEEEISSQLMIENGILERRLASTQKTIEAAKERVAVLLDQGSKTQEKLREKEACKAKLEKKLSTIDMEIVSKEGAASRLTRINKNLLKFRSIEEDKNSEVKLEWNENAKQQMAQVQKEINEKQIVMQSQSKDIEATKEQIEELTKLAEEEAIKKSKIVSQINKFSTKINSYHAALENLQENIQKPDELRKILTNLSESRTMPNSSLKQDDQHEVARKNEVLIKLLAMRNELEQLKADEVAMMKSHREERQQQILLNAKLLERSSNKTNRKFSRQPSGILASR